MKSICLKNCLKFTLLIGLLSAGPVWASAPFQVDLTYYYEGKLLQIDIERLSRDEVKHFMQRVLVFRDGVEKIVEPLSNQNHLNEITKYMAFYAEEGEEIEVRLFYGNEEIHKESIVVSKRSKLGSSTSLGHKKTGSVLIEEESTIESVLEDAEKKHEPYRIKEKLSYGESGLGYESQDSRFGYGQDENDFYNIENGKDEDSYKIIHPKEGYEDPGEPNVGQSGFGYKGVGYEGEKNSFGRKSYSSSGD